MDFDSNSPPVASEGVMGDNTSNVSSNWARDNFEYADEIRMEKSLSSEGSCDLPNEDPVSAAVSLVVGSARQGVIALCASVAHILRDKSRLQDKVASLEKQIVALENSSNGSESLRGNCSGHCQSSRTTGIQESHVKHRCGSAPASMIANELKFVRSEGDSNVMGARDTNSRCSNVKGDGLVFKSGTGECRVSSVSMPETNSNLLPKTNSNCDTKSFVRGMRQASTRSLNFCQNLLSTSFVRRKYNTISLRRVRRSVAHRQKTSSICSTNSIISSNSCTNSEDQRRNSNNSSCIITVAEVHTPPDQQIGYESKENEVVKLLARTLTNVIENNSLDVGASGDAEANCSYASDASDGQEFSLPHPLAGCECSICVRLASEPGCQLYALTTEGGPLLPHGSRVLVKGERVGTVIYFGHKRYSSVHQGYCSLGSNELSALQEGCTCPVGVTVKLLGPEFGEMFVPLSGVVCQLDDELDLSRKESWSSLEYEYLDEDSDEERLEISEVAWNDESQSSHNNILTNGNLQAFNKVHADDSKGRELDPEHCFIRTPSVSSRNSVTSHSIGDLSNYGLGFEDNACELGQDDPLYSNSNVTTTHEMPIDNIADTQVNIREFDTQGETCSGNAILNTTFVNDKNADDHLSKREFNDNFSGSLYDTCDSAISLSFSRRLQYSEDTSGPSSLTDTGTDSPHFGDTWDSGCSVGRVRCRSDSSGHCSDVELENTRSGHTITRSLGDALDIVLEKHNIQRDWPLDKHCIENEKKHTHHYRTKLSKNCWGTEHLSDAAMDVLGDIKAHSDVYEIKENVPGQSEV